MPIQKLYSAIEKVYKNKYIGISFHKMRYTTTARIIIPHYIHSYKNIPDILTKSLGIFELNNITNKVLK